jgi:hypothetical protein
MPLGAIECFCENSLFLPERLKVIEVFSEKCGVLIVKAEWRDSARF